VAAAPRDRPGPAVLAPDLPSPAEDPRDESVGELIHRLVDDGKAYARAELAVVKGVAKRRAAKAKKGAVLLVIGITLMMCSMTALVLALVLGLATLIGPLGAGLAVFLILAVVGGLLLRAGIKGLGALGGDEEERRALASPETMR
jgi:Putative Actinobacterial Holin-X, holin superfamily III